MDHHYDGVAKGATRLLTAIDHYSQAHNSKLPTLRELRGDMKGCTEASMLSYLYELERRGDVSFVMTVRGAEIFERHYHHEA